MELDHKAYDLLVRIVGEERAVPYHPLNRHPLVFSDVELGEEYGGPDDGAPTLQVAHREQVKTLGGSRAWSWVQMAFNPPLRAQLRHEYRVAHEQHHRGERDDSPDSSTGP